MAKRAFGRAVFVQGFLNCFISFIPPIWNTIHQWLKAGRVISWVTLSGIRYALTSLHIYPWRPFKNILSCSFSCVSEILPSNIWMLSIFNQTKGLTPYPSLSTSLLLCLLPWGFLWTPLVNICSVVYCGIFFSARISFLNSRTICNLLKIKTSYI